MADAFDRARKLGVVVKPLPDALPCNTATHPELGLVLLRENPSRARMERWLSEALDLVERCRLSIN